MSQHISSERLQQDASRAVRDGDRPQRGEAIADAFLAGGYQDQLSRRQVIMGVCAAAAAAVLCGLPRRARAAEATQETLDALSDAQAQYDAVQAQLDDIASQFQTLTEQQQSTLDQIESVQTEIDATQAQIDEKQAEIEAKQETLANSVAANYKGGPANMLEMLLSSQSFDDLISSFYYANRMNDQVEVAIEAVARLREELTARKADLEQQQSDLEALRDQQQQQMSAMQEKQQEAQDMLAGLDSQVKELMEKRDAEILAAAEAEARAAEEARRQQALASAGSSGGGLAYIPQAGSGQEYSAASPAQQRVVDSCYATPSPGANYCAMWVSRVFQNAGLGYPGGNANDMYASYCTYSSKADLKVGMIVAVSTYSKNTAGRIWGHVGIYIGDNRVMENIGYINTNSLDSWCQYYGDTVTPRWGWVFGRNLANQS